LTELAALRPTISETGIEIVASLAQHRILTTAQVRAIHLHDAGERWVQKLLARLAKAGLAGHIDSPARRVAYGTRPSAASSSY
jgi:hypothetical protein